MQYEGRTYIYFQEILSRFLYELPDKKSRLVENIERLKEKQALNNRKKLKILKRLIIFQT